MELSTLSNDSLQARLKSLVDKETLTTVQILHHLNEVERRELHLGLGFSSLWDYATRGLLYSEPAAHRRISSARALAKFPVLERLLCERKLNLTTLSLIAGLLSPESCNTVLAKVVGKTKREVEAFISTYRPATRVVEKVSPITIAVPVQVKPQVTFSKSKEEAQRAAPAFSKPGDPPPTVQVFKIQCAVSKEGYNKLKEVESLLSHSVTSIGEVIERLCEYYLTKESPTRPVRGMRQGCNGDSRYIPRALEKVVWERDGGCCSYRSPDGKRCGSKFQVQVDHIKPFGFGGKTEDGNLRLLCGKHNRFAAKEASRR